MELENIPLDKGIHRTPSIGDASELSECVNLMPQYGEMRNIEPPQAVEGIELAENETLIYIHKRGGEGSYTNYIKHFTDGQTHEVRLHGASEPLLSLEPLSTTSIGNTLCVSTTEGIYYLLWRDEKYVSLGNRLPEVGMKFNLLGRFCCSPIIIGEGLRGGSASSTDVILMDPIENYENFVYSELNKIEHESLKKNAFMYPFFVRYAIRMFDGSHSMLSAPILMMPSDDGKPVCTAIVADGPGFTHDFDINIYYASTKLAYKLISDLGQLKNWTDIIQGVDVYVSPQFQGYRESGGLTLADSVLTRITEVSSDNTTEHCTNKFKKLVGLFGAESSEFILDAPTEYPNAATRTEKITSGMAERVAKIANDDKNSALVVAEFPLAWINIEDWKKSIKDSNTFYKIAELDLLDLLEREEQTYEYLHIRDGVLESLETQEHLTEDTGNSHYFYSGSRLLSYNARLLVADTSLHISNRMDLATFFPTSYKPNMVAWVKPKAYVELEYEGKTYIAKLSSSLQIDFVGNIYHFFYPDRHAKRVFIINTIHTDEAPYYCLNLRPHPTLNGAYWYGDMRYAEPVSVLPYTKEQLETMSANVKVNQSNQLLMSEVDNPFVFKGSNFLTLPSRILNASTAAKALSQGQFGQFPLYAFCEDGIWAVQIDAEGRISAKQPITRDVIIHQDALCQLDGSVAFLTKEGVKIISGSQTECISIPLHGYNLDDTQYKPLLPEDYQSLAPMDDKPFFTQLGESTRLVYDAPHQLLHLFTQRLNEQGLHYVNLLGTNEWVMQKLNDSVKAVVPGYPLSTLQMGKRIFTYDHLNDADTLRKGYFLTRSTFLGNAWSRKALYDLRVMGQRLLPDSSWQVIVLISNDGMHWTRLKSLKAGSCRYYRFLVYSNLCDADTISGITLQYEERYTGKLR